jgi:hypothetical protein
MWRCWNMKVEVKLTLRLAVYHQSVRLGFNPHETHDQRYFFQLNPCGHPNITPSLKGRLVCLLWLCLAFRQVYVLHIQHVTENSSFCTLYKSSVSTGFAKHFMPTLRILCCNGSLVTFVYIIFIYSNPTLEKIRRVSVTDNSCSAK